MKLPLFALLLLTTTSLYAASNQSTKMMPMEMTPEQRVNMATVHENMAACLKSDKTLQTCHSEMKESCKSMMGDEGCKMMKHDKMMKHRK